MNEGLTGGTWLKLTRQTVSHSVGVAGIHKHLWLHSGVTEWSIPHKPSLAEDGCCSEPAEQHTRFIAVVHQITLRNESNFYKRQLIELDDRLKTRSCELNVFTRSLNMFNCSSFELKSFTSLHKVWVRTVMKREHLSSVVRRSEVIRNDLNIYDI